MAFSNQTPTQQKGLDGSIEKLGGQATLTTQFRCSFTDKHTIFWVMYPCRRQVPQSSHCGCRVQQPLACTRLALLSSIFAGSFQRLHSREPLAPFVEVARS